MYKDWITRTHSSHVHPKDESVGSGPVKPLPPNSDNRADWITRTHPSAATPTLKIDK